MRMRTRRLVYGYGWLAKLETSIESPLLLVIMHQHRAASQLRQSARTRCRFSSSASSTPSCPVSEVHGYSQQISEATFSMTVC